MNNDFEKQIEATEGQEKFFTTLILEGRKDGYVNISRLTPEEWLLLRSFAGIGCSEIASALNKVPAFFSATPLSIWKEKTGHIIKIKDNSILRIGRNVEEAIVLEYEYLTGRKVLRIKDKMFLHPEYDFLFANLDGIILPASGDGYGIMEAKSTLSYVYDGWKEKLPSYYFRQGMGELSVMDKLNRYSAFLENTDKFNRCEYVDFATLILDKREVEILRLTRDGDFIEMQNKELSDWWINHIEANIPPPETAAEWAVTDPMQDSYIEATEKCYKNVAEYKNLGKQLKQIEEKQQEIKDRIIEEIKDNESLIYNGEVIATYKQQSKTSIDQKKLKAEKPEVFEEYKRVSTFRVLRPKEITVLEY